MAEYDVHREARMIEREQMEMQREQARGERLRRREMRREYRRRRRNFYSMSDDEVEYGTQRRPKSRALSRLTHLAFRSHHRPRIYASGATTSPMGTTPPQRAASVSPPGAQTPNLSHLPPVTRVASAEVYSSQHLHPNHAYTNYVRHTSTGTTSPSAPARTASRTASQTASQTQRKQRTGTGTPGTNIPEDYGQPQFAKEERWRAREKRRRQREEERERRDAAYDQAHYGKKANNPYVAGQ